MNYSKKPTKDIDGNDMPIPSDARYPLSNSKRVAIIKEDAYFQKIMNSKSSTVIILTTKKYKTCSKNNKKRVLFRK